MKKGAVPPSVDAGLVAQRVPVPGVPMVPEPDPELPPVPVPLPVPMPEPLDPVEPEPVEPVPELLAPPAPSELVRSSCSAVWVSVNACSALRTASSRSEPALLLWISRTESRSFSEALSRRCTASLLAPAEAELLAPAPDVLVSELDDVLGVLAPAPEGLAVLGDDALPGVLLEPAPMLLLPEPSVPLPLPLPLALASLPAPPAPSVEVSLAPPVVAGEVAELAEEPGDALLALDEVCAVARPAARPMEAISKVGLNFIASLSAVDAGRWTRRVLHRVAPCSCGSHPRVSGNSGNPALAGGRRLVLGQKLHGHAPAPCFLWRCRSRVVAAVSDD